MIPPPVARTRAPVVHAEAQSSATPTKAALSPRFQKVGPVSAKLSFLHLLANADRQDAKRPLAPLAGLFGDRDCGSPAPPGAPDTMPPWAGLIARPRPR